MWNLMPANYEEAVSLIPSLVNTSQESVTNAIIFLNEKRGISRGI